MNRLADTNVWNDAATASVRYLTHPLTSADYDLSYAVADTRPNLFDTLAAENVQRDAASHYRRQAYKLRLQKWVAGLCVAAAVFAVVWIGGLELIGLVK